MEKEPRRVPLTGSCHCGHIRYIIHLTLPHPHDPSAPPSSSGQRFYRCNCTVCHKMGHFHVRPSSPTHDFLLLTPSSPSASTSPLSQLGNYTTGAGNLNFYFCQTCGVRCFIFAGTDFEPVTVNLEELGVGWKDGGEEVQAWRPRLGGGHPEMGHYVSVNGHTIDAGQEAFDMRALTEGNMVQYCDCYSPEEDEAPLQYGKPHIYGSY